MSTDLIKTVSITNILSQREACIEHLRVALDALKAARDCAGRGQLGFPTIEVSLNKYSERHIGPEHLDALVRKIDSGAWNHLFNESGMQTFMNADARNKFRSQIYGEDCPALTLSNIASTFGALHESRGELLEQGVLAVFRSLSYDYRSNSPMRFSKKVIVRHAIDGQGSRYASVSCSARDKLDDLVRCFCVLDGQPEPDHRDAWREGLRGRDLKAENAYVAVRGYGHAGTVHVTFKRPDLVDRMNAILTKAYPNALPSHV